MEPLCRTVVFCGFLFPDAPCPEMLDATAITIGKRGRIGHRRLWWMRRASSSATRHCRAGAGGTTPPRWCVGEFVRAFSLTGANGKGGLSRLPVVNHPDVVDAASKSKLSSGGGPSGGKKGKKSEEQAGLLDEFAIRYALGRERPCTGSSTAKCLTTATMEATDVG